MTKQDATSVGLKLLGVYAILSFITQLRMFGWIVAALGHAESGAREYIPFAITTTVLLFHAALSYLLIVKGDRLAERLFPAQAEEAPQAPPESLVPAQTVGFSILGAYFVLHAIPNLANTISQFIALAGMPDVGRPLKSQLPPMIGNVIQLVLGVFLFSSPPSPNVAHLLSSLI